MATKVKLVADGVITPDQITLTTASTGTNTTAPATTAFVQQEITALVDSSPAALNTLNELAAALGDDPNFATTVNTNIATKLPLAGGTMTGDIFINGGSTTERSLRIQNTDSILYVGVEGSSGNRFIDSSANNAFLGTTTNSGLEFGTANTVRAVIDTSGNVGIGTTSPGVKLDIKTTGGYDYGIRVGSEGGYSKVITYADVASTPTKYNWIAGTQYNINDGFEITPSTAVGGYTFSNPALVILQNGNVGIGTNNPSGKFVVSNGGAEGFEIFPGSASGQNSFQHYNRSGSAYLRNRNIASEFTFNLSGATDDAVTFKSDGNVGIGTNNPGFYEGSGLEIQRAGIATLRLQNTSTVKSVELTQDTNFKIEAMNSSMDFLLYPTGNVGIGDNPNPDYKLDVKSDAASISKIVQRIWNPNTSWTAEALTRYYADSDSTAFPVAEIGFHRGYSSIGNPSAGFIVKTGISTAASTERLRVSATGNVGIGTSTPESVLHIVSAGQFDGLTIERSTSTPSIKFVSGVDAAGTFGFQLMDNNEWWVGTYDGSNYDYWIQSSNSAVRVKKPISSFTDSGAKQYSHLCTGSFYQSTGAIVINTNIPGYNTAGNSNMFSIKIRGYEYAVHGSIDMNIGGYVGENNHYSVNYNGNYVPEGWVDSVQFCKNNTTGKLAIVLGSTAATQRIEMAVVDFIQGYSNVNESYAQGWSISCLSSLSDYSFFTSAEPRMSSPRPGFHAYLSAGQSFISGTHVRTLGSTTYNRGGHYNTSNSRFTAPTDGVYHFDMALQLSAGATTQTYVSAEVRLNGGNRYIGGWFEKTGAGYGAATGSVTIPMGRGDYVEFICELASSATVLGGVPGYTYLSGVQIG